MRTIAAIFDIQKFSIHDGPGIRTTVFFKGCHLACPWCHNPESQNMKKEMLFDKKKCTACGTCAAVCPTEALSMEDGKLTFALDRCNFCGECVIYCLNGAREIAGKEYTIDEVLKVVLQDKIFYKHSGGGVTLSGGEPLLQIEFVEELLKRLKEEGISTAIDTCGAVPFEVLEWVSQYTDLFLYDIKLMDDQKHLIYTGTSNRIVLDNLVRLSRIHDNIQIRMPIIEGVNADVSHIEETLKFITGLNIKKINLLPYHDFAMHKYDKLELSYDEKLMSVPSNEKIEQFKEMLEKAGYTVKIGG